MTADRPPVSGEPRICKPGCILDDRAHDVPCVVEEACWTCGHPIAVEWDEDGTPRNVKPIEASTGAALDVERLNAILDAASLDLEYVGPGDIEAEEVTERFIRFARLAEQEGEDR